MSKFTKISIAAVIILFCAVGFAWCMNNEAQAAEHDEYAQGVVSIMVTDHSRYIIDVRLGPEKCFYETTTINGVSVVVLSQHQCYYIKTYIDKGHNKTH